MHCETRHFSVHSVHFVGFACLKQKISVRHFWTWKSFPHRCQLVQRCAKVCREQELAYDVIRMCNDCNVYLMFQFLDPAEPKEALQVPFGALATFLVK